MALRDASFCPSRWYFAETGYHVYSASLQICGLIPAAEQSAMFSHSYGDIYETQLEWAKGSKLNKTQDAIPTGHKEYMLPILQGKL